MKDKHKIAIIVVSMVIGLGMIGISLLMANSKDDSAEDSKIITSKELSIANGKDGQPCYVAVDRAVYEIKQGNKWKDGKHEPSEGQAYCGADLSLVIDKSPHGRSILTLANKIGLLGD